MTHRLMIAAGTLALGLGLVSAASAQGMQPGAGGQMQQGQMQPGMEQGGMEQGGMQQRPMRSKKMMKRSSKKKMMRSRRGAM